ncbi:BTB/POZ domain-containing protein 6-B-like [Paramacrobiotus metropolitanus]|uniref:BTB/POZ domain-containing protein 6-B-like n=1 Tax=Paramacrobiotus metropolitanus TaxID=2943436 RepID=UPI002445FC57|nr:BTB/POZ domain-containing protein 6-B-like [Paramacrobiotus metropolitanus]
MYSVSTNFDPYMSRTSRTSNATHVEREPDTSGIRQSLKAALISGDLSDVQLAVGRDYGPVKTFSAHKNILSIRSPVFRAMFYGSLPESCDRPIEVPDVHPTAFANMLSYLYADRVDLNNESVVPTLYCADRYDIPLLVDICSQYVLSDLDEESCLMYLDMTINWHAGTFVEPCLMVIDAHTESVLLSKQFSQLEKNTLELILQRSTLQAMENDIYKAVEKWATACCVRSKEEPTATNRRRVLGELLSLVRFPLMSDQELLDGPAASGLLLPAELWDIYRYRHAATPPEIPFSAQPRESLNRIMMLHLPDEIIQGPAMVEQRLLGLVTIVLRRGDDRGLGFTISGGYESGSKAKPIVVEKIPAGGQAYQDGRLQHGDRIIRVNGESLLAATHNDAVSVIRKAGNFLVLDILREKLLGSNQH